MSEMTPESACKILGLPPNADNETVRAHYAELHAEYQVRLTNAPTAALKSRYQRQLEDLREAAEALAPEFAARGSADLPALTPVIDAEKGDPRRREVPSFPGVPPPPPSGKHTALRVILAMVASVVVAIGILAVVRHKPSSQSAPGRDVIPSETVSDSQQTKSTTGTLLISADVASVVQVDDQNVGEVKPGSPIRWEVEAGQEHLVRAVPRSGTGEWTKTVEVSAGGQKVVRVALSRQVSAKPQLPKQETSQEDDIAEAGGWMWTPSSGSYGRDKNGNNFWLTIDEALSLAANCRAGGYTDWHLPSFADLLEIAPEIDAAFSDKIWTTNKASDQLPVGVKNGIEAQFLTSARPLVATIYKGKVTAREETKINHAYAICVRKRDAR